LNDVWHDRKTGVDAVFWLCIMRTFAADAAEKKVGQVADFFCSLKI
jgi:hypothetical protein